jgi:hypothetical protein
VDFLVQHHGGLDHGGLAALANFWRAIGAGSTWQAAFQSAFGETVDQFYAEFAAYRATL